MSAPQYVFPDPGGPWIGRTVASRSLAMRTANATADSPSAAAKSPDFSLGVAAFSVAPGSIATR